VAARVARRWVRRKPVAVGRSRRRAAQERVRVELRARIGEVVTEAVERALQAEVTALVGRERYRRRATADWATVAARCSRCGADWSRRFWRDGTYHGRC
jgi:hypothetical protein